MTARSRMLRRGATPPRVWALMPRGKTEHAPNGFSRPGTLPPERQIELSNRGTLRVLLRRRPNPPAVCPVPLRSLLFSCVGKRSRDDGDDEWAASMRGEGSAGGEYHSTAELSISLPRGSAVDHARDETLMARSVAHSSSREEGTPYVFDAIAPSPPHLTGG